MILKPNSAATSRTRNHIRRNGPRFEDITNQFLGRTSGRVDFEDGRGALQCVLVRAEGARPAADGWIGWLPIEEIERTTSGGVKFYWPIDENGDFQSGGWVCSDHHKRLAEEQLAEVGADESHRLPMPQVWGGQTDRPCACEDFPCCGHGGE